MNEDERENSVGATAINASGTQLPNRAKERERGVAGSGVAIDARRRDFTTTLSSIPEERVVRIAARRNGLCNY